MDHRMDDQITEPPDEDDIKYSLLVGLDILGIEDACIRKYFDSIPPMKILLLQKALAKSKAQNQLGVSNAGQKDKKKAQRESKKRGQKSSLQRINRLSTTLVESDQYAQLT